MGDTVLDMGAPSELSTGTVIAGEFTIKRRIVRCDLGVVYEADRRSTGRPCALKALDHAQRRTAAEREHFQREARIASRVGGPHCPAVLGAGADPDLDALWIAMEALVGETLAERLTRLGVGVPMEVPDALAVIEQLCRGLTLVHEKSLVHRDLKPANVFLARGDPFTVKILDFSAAYAPDEPGSEDASPGTPLWMSPEQATNSPITPATDVWAVGLLAFRMLAGRSYWWGARNAVVEMRAFLDELLESQLASASERALEVGCDRPLPDGFDAWFARCVTRGPRKRFRDADEMSFALRDVSHDPVRPGAAPRRPTPPSRAPTMRMPAYRERAEPQRPSTPAGEGRRSSAPPALDAPRRPSISPTAATYSPATQALYEKPVSFAFLDEEQTRTLPPRKAVAKPWRPMVLGFGIGVLVVTGVVAVLARRMAPQAAPRAVTVIAVPSAGAEASAPPVPARPTPPHAGSSPRAASRPIAPQPVALRLVAPQPAAPQPVAPQPVAPQPVAPQPVASQAEAGDEWTVGARRVWTGRASGDDGEWSFVLVLQRTDATAVRGRFAWSAVRSPTARVGEQVRESLEGTWQPATGALDLRGVTSTSPQALPVNAYRLRVRANGAIGGASIDDRETLMGAPGLSSRRRR